MVLSKHSTRRIDDYRDPFAPSTALTAVFLETGVETTANWLETLSWKIHRKVDTVSAAE